MTLLYIWIAFSLGFALGWVVRFALARRRREEPTSPVHTIDLRAAPFERSRYLKGGSPTSRTVVRSPLSSN